MSIPTNSISQKEYLKKYLSGDVKDVKRKKKRIIKGSKTSSIKRSKIIDDDIDLNSMRPLGDDEIELYQMDEEAPQIAGIIDERPEDVKAQEYYNSKRWKVFGGDDGVNVVDSLMKNENSDVEKLSHNRLENVSDKDRLHKQSESRDSYDSSIRPRKDIADSSKKNEQKNKIKGDKYTGAQSQTHNESDLSPPRNDSKIRKNSDSDYSPPRRDQSSNYSQESRKNPNLKSDMHDRSYQRRKKERRKYKGDSDNSPPRKGNKSLCDSDSDNSPPRKSRERLNKHKSDSDISPPRAKNNTKRIDDKRKKYSEKYMARTKSRSSSDSDNSPPRNSRKVSSSHMNSSSRYKSKRDARSISPQTKQSSSRNRHLSDKKNSSRLSRKDSRFETNVKKEFSDSDQSPPRRSATSQNNGSSSDLSPPRKANDQKPQKKKLYLPNDGSSSDEKRSKNKKMKTTLDGKQAGLQDAKQLKKELSDLKTREDLMFSKMDASVSGVGAKAIKRDRKTGQIRDLEKEKEIQKEKEAKASIVNEKYSKWGRGLKQVEDAKERAAEALKEMNKPLARYVDDQDLDNFLKAQEREGDPMLDYIKQKQKEATPLAGEKPMYRGSYNPNRFGIRPGHRWDGVVRSNGFEKEWFTHQNARKARDEEAYKWSTSDM